MENPDTIRPRKTPTAALIDFSKFLFKNNSPAIAPIKAAVVPLKRNNEDLVKAAYELKDQLQSLRLGRVVVENSGNIGKSYRRHDEVGTPMCITIDFQTLEDGTVTLRDRDSMEQERVHLDMVGKTFQERIVRTDSR